MSNGWAGRMVYDTHSKISYRSTSVGGYGYGRATGKGVTAI